jgi:hypothetical protein
MDKQIRLIETVNESSDSFVDSLEYYFCQQTNKNLYQNDFIDSIIKILEEVYKLPQRSKILLLNKMCFKKGNFEFFNDFDKYLVPSILSYEQCCSYLSDKKISANKTNSNHADQRVIINNIIVLLKSRILKWNTSGSKSQNLDNKKSLGVRHNHGKSETDPQSQILSSEVSPVNNKLSNQPISREQQSVLEEYSDPFPETTTNIGGENYESPTSIINDMPRGVSNSNLDGTSATSTTKEEVTASKNKPLNSNNTDNEINDDLVDSIVYPNAGRMRWEQIGFRSIVLLLLFGILGFVWYNTNNIKSFVQKNSNNITKQLGQIYTPPTEEEKDYGYLKTQFEKLSKLESYPPKLSDSSPSKITGPDIPVFSESKKSTLFLDEIVPTLKTNLVDLNNKIEALKKIGEKVEVKLDDAKIKEVFNSIVKDENSDLGKMIKKINATGDKKPVDTVDTTSAKDKKELASLKSENDKLNKSIGERDKEISKEKASVTILNGEVDKKNKEIDKLETKLKSIGDEKTGFKGPSGHFAILLTNSKDFELTEPILSATLVAVEKQNKENKGVQKVGIYAATGNSIDVKFSLKKGTRGLKPTEMDVANARPTETIAEVGKTFLEFAFDDGKDPIIPIDDRKAIIIATWSAGAPKDGDGWDKISQVDAILIQTPKANQLREGSAWLDFILKKNGRLLFIQAEEKITGSSPSIGQLQKHLSTLLNTKKD